jgi:hypothetical protein
MKQLVYQTKKKHSIRNECTREHTPRQTKSTDAGMDGGAKVNCRLSYDFGSIDDAQRSQVHTTFIAVSFAFSTAIHN